MIAATAEGPGTMRKIRHRGRCFGRQPDRRLHAAAAAAANNFPPGADTPVAETVPKPPVTAEPLMWQPGHWDWNGSGYVWTRGEYVPAGGHGNLWTPGWWMPTPYRLGLAAAALDVIGGCGRCRGTGAKPGA